MTEPFVGQISIVGFTFAPRGWALCNGQLLPISQNTALFSLLGTNFGGDGQSTFGLPNLQGRAPMAWGMGPGLSPRTIGETGGQASVTLGVNELPTHTHEVTASTQPADRANASGARFAASADPAYAPASPASLLAPASVGITGGGQAHPNEQPYLALTFVIALQGVYPARN